MVQRFQLGLLSIQIIKWTETEKRQRKTKEKKISWELFGMLMSMFVKCRKRKIAHHSSLESINSPNGSLTDYSPKRCPSSISGFKQTCISGFHRRLLSAKKFRFQEIDAISQLNFASAMLKWDYEFRYQISKLNFRRRQTKSQLFL